MLDSYVSPQKEKALGKLRPMIKDVDSNHIVILGLGAGFACAAAIILNWTILAVMFWLLNRLVSAVVVEDTGAKDDASIWSQYVNLLLDWFSCALLPLAIGASQPVLWPMVGLFLVVYYTHQAAALFFSDLNKDKREDSSSKSCYIGAMETLLVYVLLILWPQARGVVLALFTLALVATIAQRSFYIYKVLCCNKTPNDQ